MKHMLDLLLECLVMLRAIFRIIRINTSEQLDGVPEFTHDSPWYSRLLRRPHRIIITDVTKYFLSKHLPENVEQFPLCSQP